MQTYTCYMSMLKKNRTVGLCAWAPAFCCVIQALLSKTSRRSQRRQWLEKTSWGEASFASCSFEVPFLFGL